MSKAKFKFFAELTDTFGGEANYSWVKRFVVTAVSELGALQKLSKETGFNFKVNHKGEVSRYNAKGACVCIFLSEFNGEERYYDNIKSL